MSKTVAVITTDWDNMPELDRLRIEFSDAYKDAYGVRPRRRLETETEAREALDALYAAQAAHEARKAQAAAEFADKVRALGLDPERFAYLAL